MQGGMPHKPSWQARAAAVTERASFSTSSACMNAKSLQSCPTSCYPMGNSLPGSSVHGDSPGKNTGVGFPALLPGICPPQGQNWSLLSPALAGRFFITSTTWEAPMSRGESFWQVGVAGGFSRAQIKKNLINHLWNIDPNLSRLLSDEISQLDFPFRKSYLAAIWKNNLSVA